MTEADLTKHFSPFGQVVSCRVPRDAVTHTSLGYAYVNFYDSESASAAMKELSYRPIKGKPARIMWAQRDPFSRRSGVGNLCFKNLYSGVDIRTLWETCSNFGTVVSVKLPEGADGKPLSIAFVQYESDDSANKALEILNGMDFQGKPLIVERYIKKADRQKAKTWSNVFIKNLPPSWDEAKLRALCGRFGKITSAAVPKEEEGKPKGFGFAMF